MIRSCHDYLVYTHVSLATPDGGQDPGVLRHVTGRGIKESQLRKRIRLKIYARSERACPRKDSSKMTAGAKKSGLVLHGPYFAVLISFHPEMALFRNLCVNLRDSLCSVFTLCLLVIP
jgi:hypothetical protein